MPSSSLSGLPFSCWCAPFALLFLISGSIVFSSVFQFVGTVSVLFLVGLFFCLIYMYLFFWIFSADLQAASWLLATCFSYMSVSLLITKFSELKQRKKKGGSAYVCNNCFSWRVKTLACYL